MHSAIIVILGIGAIFVVSTFIAVVAIGLREAADPSLSGPEELQQWERSRVTGERAQKIAEREEP